MAKTVKSHIHLFLNSVSNPSHDGTMFRVQAQPGPEEKPTAAVSHERGLTGALHVHSLQEAGNVVIFEDVNGLIITATMTERDALRALSGRTCYYMPNYHDDDAPFPVNRGAGNGYVCLYVIDARRELDPGQEYWSVVGRIVDDTI